VEGDFLKQPDLAGTLGRIRAHGVGDLYLGQDAKLLVEAVKAAGGTLTLEDLRDYRPLVREPISFPWESNTIWHFAGPPAVGGGVAAEMLAVLLEGQRFEKADGMLREHLIVEAAKRAFVQRMNNLQADGTYREGPETRITEAAASKISDGIDDDRATPLSSLIATPVDWPETPAAVSYAIMDTRGGAVACTLTMNNLFGTGRVAAGFGTILAAAPDNLGRTFTPVGPALLTSKLFNRAYMAAAASGGVTASTALVNVLARSAAGPQSLIEAMRAPRTHYAGVPDKVFVEESMPADIVEGLRKRGHDVVQTNAIGRVTAVYCPTGVPSEKGVSCTSANDQRGYGIALGGN
ncbi:MAG: gamma-glutamyltransferase, partial [Rhodospirillales bacterium]